MKFKNIIIPKKKCVFCTINGDFYSTYYFKSQGLT